MRFVRKPVLALMLLAALLALAACGGSSGENQVKSSGVLRVGTEGVYSPFSYHDATDELVGYDVDVAKAVGDKLGVRVEFVETPWDAMFAALEANRFDVVANEVTINDERKAKYDLSEPYSVGEGVIVTRADDNSIKTLADLKGKVAAENATSNWSEVARKAGARVESVEGFTQAIKLLNQGRVDVVVNDSIAVYAYLAETGDKTVKIAGNVGEKSEQGFAARKDSGLLPDLNKALDELRSDGTLAEISQKYLKANASGGPEAPPADSGDPVDVAARAQQPGTAGQGGDHENDSADDHQLRDRHRHRAGGRAGPAVDERDSDQHRPVLHLGHPRHPVAGAAVHRVLRAAPAGGEDRPVAGGHHRVLVERRRLRRRDHPIGDPEHPEGPVGGGRDDRPQLRRRHCDGSSCRRPPGSRCRRCPTR